MKPIIPGIRTYLVIPLLLFTLAGCYTYPYYPYGAGYGENGPYNGSYPNRTYGSSYPHGYGQQGYQGQDAYGQGYRGHHDDDDDDDNNRHWRGNPAGGYYGR